MDVSTERLQGLLDDAWETSQAANPVISLRAQLRTNEKSFERLFAGGSIGSVSKNSASQTYRGPGLGSYTPIQLADACRMLINLFDRVKNWINSELVEDPIQTVAGSVSTSGNGLATFTLPIQQGFLIGQLVTVTGAANTAFNLADSPIVFIANPTPTSTQFSYAIAVIGSVTNSASATFCPEPGVPPDNSDLSVYTTMRSRLFICYSAATDMTDLRLAPTLSPGTPIAW